MSLEKLPKFLLTVIESERYGGRVIRVDESTVVLYDCGTWSDAHSQAVHVRYPECEISITPSSASLSGFVVIAKVQRDSGVTRWGMVLCVACALIFATARHMLMMNTT
jgi:hypothetical protein